MELSGPGWLVVAVIVAALIGLRIWMQSHADQTQTRPTPVTPACGGSQTIGPFWGRRVPGWGRRGHAQVVIHVQAACGQQNAEIEIEERRNTWTPLRERVAGGALGARNDPPKVGSWYVVGVPHNRRVRLTCPAGTGNCAFSYTDITNLANQTFSVAPNAITPGCSGAHGDPRLLNFSDTTIKVRVTFTQLCTDANGRPQNGVIHEIPVRPVRPGPVKPWGGLVALPAVADTNVRPAANHPLTAWNGDLDAGYKLEASCAGQRGTCSSTVQAFG